MKNAIFRFVSIFFFVFVIFGCTNIEQNLTKKTASISVRLDSSDARNAISPDYVDGISHIILKGKLTGADEEELKEWKTTEKDGSTTTAYDALNKDPVINDLEVGKWTFTLTCYNDDGAKICSATETATLSADDTNTIHFKLENTKGDGSVEIGLSINLSLKDTLARNYMGEVRRTENGETAIIEAQSSGYSIKACLKDLNGTVVKKSDDVLPIEITDNSSCSVYYAEEEIPAGSYIVSFMVYEKKTGAEEVLLTTVSELVNVAPELNTTTGNATLKLASLNKSYELGYKSVVFDQQGNSSSPTNFDTSWFLKTNETLPVTYTAYDKFVLPTEILREGEENVSEIFTGYMFSGWYTDETCTTPADSIDGENFAAKSIETLYAKFDEFTVRLASSSSDPYYGLENKVDMVIEFSGITEIPSDWKTNMIWTSSDEILTVDQKCATSAVAGNCVTLGAKSNGLGRYVDITASLYGKTIGKIKYYITNVLTDYVYEALAKEQSNNNLTEITSFKVPEGYVTIGNLGAETFSKTTNLETLEIPSTVTEISSSAFENVNKIKTIIINCTNPPILSSTNIFRWGNDAPDKICVPYSAFETYKNKCANNEDDWDQNWTIEIIPVVFTQDIFRALEPNYATITEYSIPNGYTEIEGNSAYQKAAFAGCKALTTVIIPESITLIGQYAFYDCDNLTSATMQSKTPPELKSDVFAKNVTVTADDSTGEYTKKKTESASTWKNVTIENQSSLGIFTRNAFLKQCADNNQDYQTVTSFTIPTGYTAIESGASDKNGVFYGCTKLKNVEIPDGVTSIGAYAFSGCTSLEEITIPSSVGKIAAGAFNKCAAIKTVKYDGAIADWCRIDFVSGLGSTNPFVSSGSAKLYIKKGSEYESPKGTIDLSSVSGNAITTIPYGTFRNCTELTSISLPTSLKTIESYAFQGCTSLTEIILPVNVEVINDYAFDNCTNLQKVTVKNTTPTKLDGEHVFNNCDLKSIIVPDLFKYQSAENWSVYEGIMNDK